MTNILLIIFLIFFGGVLLLNIHVMMNKNRYRDIKKRTWREKARQLSASH